VRKFFWHGGVHKVRCKIFDRQQNRRERIRILAQRGIFSDSTSGFLEERKKLHETISELSMKNAVLEKNSISLQHQLSEAQAELAIFRVDFESIKKRYAMHDVDVQDSENSTRRGKPKVKTSAESKELPMRSARLKARNT
jgi:regulator of replication initiation timing